MSQINVNTITGKDGGSAVNFPHGITVTGVVTATTLNQNVTGNVTAGSFTGPLTGNVTGNLTGNVTGNTSGTAGSTGVLSAGATGADLTLSGNLTVNGTQTVIDTATLSVEDKNIGIGSVTTPTNTTANGGGLTLFGGADGDKEFKWVDSGTGPDYWSLTGGLLYSQTGANFGGLLKEAVKTLGNDLASVSTIDLVDGMTHMRTPNLGHDVSPNIRYSSTIPLGQSVNIGEGLTVTIIQSTNNTNYKVTGLNIDGVQQTVSWIGGSAPTDGGSAGIDIYTFNIIKYGSGTTDYTVIGNQTKTS